MQALIVSNVLLWLLLIATSLVMVGLIRQIGVLHSRIAPAGALMMDKGVEVGAIAIKIPACAMNEVSNFDNIAFKQTTRIWIGQHDTGNVITFFQLFA